MSAGRDEVGLLRAALEAGRWRALLEPGAEALLVVALLADAGPWWLGPVGPRELRGAAAAVTGGITSELTRRAGTNGARSAAFDAWMAERAFTPEEYRADLAFVAAVLDSSEGDLTDHRRALAILARVAG